MFVSCVVYIMTTTTFKLKDLSPFYKNSKFYNESLSEYDENEDIPIDKRFWIEDFSFLDCKDINLKSIRHAADVYRFWGIHDIHASFYHALMKRIDDYGTFFEDYKDFPDIYNFKRVVTLDNPDPTEELKACIKTGSLPILKQYYSEYRTFLSAFFNIHVLSHIAEIGNIDCLKYALKTGTVKWTIPYCHVIPPNFDKKRCSAVHISAQKGNYECMVFAIENHAPYDIRYLYNYAINSGNIDCVKYLYEKHGDKLIMTNYDVKRMIGINYDKCRDAIFYLSTKKLKSLEYNKIYREATGHDRLDLIKHLHKLGIKMPNCITMHCCTPETLKFLVEDCGQSINNTTIAVFAEKGLLCMVKYAVEERGCKLDNDVMEATIEADQLHCFKYLLEKECSFDYDLSEFICANGSVKFLKCIIEHEHNISPSAMCFAYIKDNVLCFKYLIEELRFEPNPLFLNDHTEWKGNSILCKRFLEQRT